MRTTASLANNAGEHEQSVVQLQEAAVQKDEESRALRRQLIAAGLDPCV